MDVWVDGELGDGFPDQRLEARLCTILGDLGGRVGGTRTAGNTAPFSVTVDRLVVTTKPAARVTNGGSINLVVNAVDALGNLDTSFDGPLTIGLGFASTASTLGGTLSATATGIASFSGITPDRAGIETRTQLVMTTASPAQDRPTNARRSRNKLRPLSSPIQTWGRGAARTSGLIGAGCSHVSEALADGNRARPATAS
jgi:hypothetical protein